MTGLLLLLPIAGCGVFNSGPSASDVASEFLRAYAAGDTAGAAARTDAPEAARPVLDDTRRALEPKALTPQVGETTEGEPTSVRYELTWDFGDGRVWRYPSSMQLVEGEQGWKVRWSPAVIHPQLGPKQTLALNEQPPEPAPVLDRDGVRLMGPEQLVTVSLNAKEAGDLPRVADELAGALGSIDPDITRQSILDGVARTPPDQPYAVVTLRQADYERVRAGIYDLPGVRFPAQEKLVSAERGYASQVLGGLARRVDDEVAAGTGWRVTTVNEGGGEAATLHDVPPRPVGPVNATLSDRVQRAAEQAVDPVPQATMLVAMQPSTGEVLAVAQNAPADAQGAVALTGQYPPGSTFKIATATAALETGQLGIDTPVACPAKKVFDGRVVPNDKEFDLGTVPLRTAFARSCNTTFAQLAVDEPAGALTDAAKRLGIGVDFDMAGATTITGAAPEAEGTVQRAENGIGQGKVLASPFGMALATATVAKGSMPVPTLVRGAETKADAIPQPPSQRTLDQLRPMMREVVTSGTATALAGSGEVRGKTGTAQFGDGTHSHGWFVGYRDDLAFAVLVTDAGASGPAVDVARKFLGAA
ncbi:penicillin-binding transpeptidase domain-containing protein [Saccharopolyspora taberi]|uniref:Penicillin-binding transpeptidase domain-containing protein n=1 Tax=Saccharopolyspora taberi TaxID=60895 RepID=A0ABN3V6K0_9PSEU